MSVNRSFCMFRQDSPDRESRYSSELFLCSLLLLSRNVHLAYTFKARCCHARKQLSSGRLYFPLPRAGNKLSSSGGRA